MKGIICRYAYDGTPPMQRREFLCRDEALFAECEWHWSREELQAHRFESFHDADLARADHVCADANGEAYMLFALPVVQDVCEARPEVALHQRARRSRSTPDTHLDEVLEGMERRHPHEEVYAETQRRIGEHD
jgi:hypothetical protein